ncbi:MAG: thioredoxin domain-containing protein [Acidimicrobiales bacterium]
MAVRITVLTAPACDLCRHANAVLARVGEDHDLEVVELSTETERGRRLMVEHRVAFPPGVLIDGAAFSYGRLSERKLRRELEARGAPRAG